MFVVPSDDQRAFPLELRLVFRHDGLPEDVFEKAVESFHHSYAPVLVNRSEARQAVHGLAPQAFEVLALPERMVAKSSIGREGRCWPAATRRLAGSYVSTKYSGRTP